MANPYQGDDYDYFEAARDKKTGRVKQTGLSPTAKLSNFGAAFNAARKAGDKTFMFKGKKYTTDVAKPKTKSDTDIITEGATKLYNESSGGFKPMTMDQIARAEELTAGMSDTARSQMGEFGTMKKGGMVKKMKKGGTVSSASKRADGIAVKGKTKGRFV